MSLLDNLQSDLRRAQAEQQASLLVQVLRRRLDVLTFGDLLQILNSRLGEGLGALLVRELITGTEAAPAADSSTRATDAADAAARKPSRRHRAAAKEGKATTAKKSAKKVAKGKSRRAATLPPGAPATPPKVSAVTVAGRERYDAAVHRFLVEHSDWQASGLLRAHVGGTKVQIRGALERLHEAGLVERVGKFGTTKWRARVPA